MLLFMLFLWGRDFVVLHWTGVRMLGWCSVPETLGIQVLIKMSLKISVACLEIAPANKQGDGEQWWNCLTF